ncbi:hypothetical protein LRY64_00335 [Candidatus Woesebacteria bacterium]|nr:hypothetical protein [Candidatus Woesebacteria bacterium]
MSLRRRQKNESIDWNSQDVRALIAALREITFVLDKNSFSEKLEQFSQCLQAIPFEEILQYDATITEEYFRLQKPPQEKSNEAVFWENIHYGLKSLSDLDATTWHPLLQALSNSRQEIAKRFYGEQLTQLYKSIQREIHTASTETSTEFKQKILHDGLRQFLLDMTPFHFSLPFDTYEERLTYALNNFQVGVRARLQQPDLYK